MSSNLVLFISRQRPISLPSGVIDQSTPKMFKIIISVLLLLALTNAEDAEKVSETEPEPEVEKPIIRILSFRNEQRLDGSYKFEYESEDGIKRYEQGYYKETDKNEDGRAQVMEGAYTYTDPDGEVVNIRYVADENGFRPEGNVIHPAITKYLHDLESKDTPEEQVGTKEGPNPSIT